MDFVSSFAMRRAWLMVGLLWVVAFLNYLDRMILITMRSSIKDSIPMTDAQFGMLTSVFLLTYGTLSPFGGFIADRFNRSRLIIFSLFAWSATTWMTAHATTFGGMLACRALMGISEAAYFPAAGALLMDYHREGTRSRANAIHLSGVMVGSGLGGLGGLIAESYDWQFVFRLFGFIGIAYAAVLMLLLRDRPKDALVVGEPLAPVVSPIRMVETVLALFKLRAFVIALIFWGLLAVASWSFAGWLPAYLHEQFGMSQGKAGLTALGYSYSASLVGMVLGGLIADRWIRRNPRGRILTGVVGVLCAAPAALIVGNSSLLVVVILGMVLFGLVRPFPDASMTPILTQIVEKRHLATAVGFLNMLAVFVGGITVYIGGVVRDAHIPITVMFNCGAVGLFFCAALLWSVKPRPPASPASVP